MSDVQPHLPAVAVQRPRYQPPHTGKHRSPVVRLKIKASHRKRSLMLLDARYASQRAELLADLAQIEAELQAAQEAEREGGGPE